MAAGFDFRQGSWNALRFVLPFLKTQLRRLLLVCLLDVSIVLVNLTVPWFGKFILDQAFPARDWILVLKIAAAIAGLTLLVYGMSALRTFLYNTAEMLLGLEIRRKMYGHLRTLSLDTVEALPVGQHQFRITTDADRIAHMLVRILPTATMLVEFALILAAAVYVDPILTLIVLAFLVPWTVLFIWVTHYGRILDRRRLHFGETRDASLLQGVSSFATIKSYGRTRFELHRNARASVAVQRVAAQGYMILVGFELFTQKLLPYLKSTTIYVLLVRKVILGQMTLGMTVPMISYLGRLTYPIERIVNFGCWIWQTMVSAERLMQILSTEPAIKDRPDALRLERVEGRLAFEGVSLDRAGVGVVVDDLTLALEPGKRTAIVGASGAGKSTLVNLALRLADPTSGTVRIDDHDLRDVALESYQRHIGTVLQETVIFAGSLADNLRLTQPEATDAQIWSALERVDLSEWARSLKGGLDEDLESGEGLSAGQKQRLGIARALLLEPSILILDEPTSALDVETESQIAAMLASQFEGTTVLWVTHRLRTIANADRIVVLDRGRIAEQGSHEELLERRGLYAELITIDQSHGVSPEKLELKR